MQDMLPPGANFINARQTKIEGLPAGVLEYSTRLGESGHRYRHAVYFLHRLHADKRIGRHAALVAHPPGKATRETVDRTDRFWPCIPEKTHIAQMLRDDMKAADIEINDCAGRPRNVHSLRHSFGTHLSRAGVHPKDIMELMRHSDVNVTLARYTHATVRDRVAAISMLPDLSDQGATYGATRFSVGS